MLELLCHQCHIKDYINTALAINPECVNAELEDCSACDGIMAAFKNSGAISSIDKAELAVMLQTSFIVCNCKNSLIFVGNPFCCKTCNEVYLKICKNIGVFLSENNSNYQVIDLDKLLGKQPISECLNLHDEDEVMKVLNANIC